MKMAEYIEREALNVAIHESWQSNPHNNPIARQTHNHEHRHFLSLLHKQPAADVVEVRHGEWKKIELLGCEPMYECSICEKLHDQDYNYCNNCGAKMDGKGDGE